MSTGRAPRRTRRPDERGSAVWVVPFVGVLVLMALALAFQGGLLVAPDKDSWEMLRREVFVD